MNISRKRLTVPQILKPKDWLLLPIIGLAVYLAFLPHQNYPYPLHLDEWVQLANSNELIRNQGLAGLANPFYGGPAVLSQTGEIGSHLLWAVFYQISGIPWLDIYKYFPCVIFVITVLSAYMLGRRLGFGWQAAFFTTLIPTTVGILGPAFLVPAALALPFIPLSLFLAFNFRTVWSYLTLLIFVAVSITIHPPTAAALAIALLPYILVSIKGDFRHALALAFVLVLPFAVLFSAMDYVVLPLFKVLLVPQPLNPNVELPAITTAYGYLPILFCLAGVAYLAIKGGRANYGLVLGLLALALVTAIYFKLHYGVEIIYYRGLLSVMLLVSIVAGAGLMIVENLRLPKSLMTWSRVPLIARNGGAILCLILIGLTLYFAIPGRQDTPYYHMVDAKDYEAFVWIRDNLGSQYDRAILDPWKGAAFTAITGKYVFSFIGEAPTAKDLEAYTFLREACRDTALLRENDISIVYSRGDCDNPDLFMVRKYVYLVRDEYGDK